MRCLLCRKLSFRYVCAACERHIRPAPQIHALQRLKLISFYDYDDIESLTLAKYYPFGSAVLRRLAKRAFLPFIADLELEDGAALIGVDDRLGSYFSHTAVLAKHAAHGSKKARFGKLRARSDEKYAGQTLAFRKAHPRKFIYRSFDEPNAILIDDVCTTGTTLIEAAETLEQNGKTVLFAMVLTKAK
ncbi:hypothetical protein FACS1894103_4960 [Campylobacterota bacterium]|nr:hypothetical protein FACS1894103_4960 [Campylobacterota bacterium]